MDCERCKINLSDPDGWTRGDFAHFRYKQILCRPCADLFVRFREQCEDAFLSQSEIKLKQEKGETIECFLCSRVPYCNCN